MKMTGIVLGVLLAGVLAAADLDPFFHLAFDTEADGAAACVDRMDAKRVCKLVNPKRYSFVPGKSGKALSLDNAKEKMSPKENPNAGIDIGAFWDDDFAKAMSIEVWVKIGADVEYRRCLMYILQCGGQYGPGFSLYYNWQWFQFLTGPGGKSKETLVVQAPVADLRDQWVHVAVTYDGGKKTARVYINGECIQEKTGFVITPPRNRKQPMAIGRSGLSRGWRGCIDELKIYKRVLTPTEIFEHAKFEL